MKLGESKLRRGLGFRDIESFNKAWLAKHIWRMLKKLDSLVFQVMKNKFFRNGNMLDAQLGNRPSFIWRSILSAMDFSPRGLIL